MPNIIFPDHLPPAAFPNGCVPPGHAHTNRLPSIASSRLSLPDRPFPTVPSRLFLPDYPSPIITITIIHSATLRHAPRGGIGLPLRIVGPLK